MKIIFFATLREATCFVQSGCTNYLDTRDIIGYGYI
jgi:hypothetical protein